MDRMSHHTPHRLALICMPVISPLALGCSLKKNKKEEAKPLISTSCVSGYYELAHVCMSLPSFMGTMS